MKTVTYATIDGNYRYHAIKPAYLFGYTVNYWNRIPLLMAGPEKVVLDYLYLRSRLNTPKDLVAMRLNTVAINETMNWEKLTLYAQVFDNATLNKRIGLFKKNLMYIVTT